MKKESGITLVALVVYVIVMAMIITGMSLIVADFYKNTDTVQESVQETIEFNKFNIYFLKEVKSNGNKVERIGEESNEFKYILFSSGNSFSISNNAIYYNDIKICNNVTSMTVKLGVNGTENNSSVIFVKLKIGDFEHAINYKLENIY